MVQYTYMKQVNSSRLLREIQVAGLSSIDHIDTYGAVLLIYFNTALPDPEKASLDAVVAAHQLSTTRELIDGIVGNAIEFGNAMVKDFVIENVMLGITQRRLTGHVRRALREVKDAIQTGSLYDAITEIKNLNLEDFDDTIITPARMLEFRNKIEDFLNVPRAIAWDDDETWL